MKRFSQNAFAKLDIKGISIGHWGLETKLDKMPGTPLNTDRGDPHYLFRVGIPTFNCTIKRCF